MNLAAEMALLPEPPNDKQPPYWDAWRHDLWVRAQQDEPENFMQWPCVYHTMLQDHWPDAIKSESTIIPIEIGMLIMQMAAHDKVVMTSWRNLIHQAYHIHRWQETTGLNIANMHSIYEFGGGYGAMALVCCRFGFAGDYYICDLPEFALLQQWYLEQHQIENVRWVGKEAGDSVDLFIACYSLSETDFAERDRIVEAWPAQCYLLLYSNRFEQYDNLRYFQKFRNWGAAERHERIKHLPPESWYTWGW